MIDLDYMSKYNSWLMSDYFDQETINELKNISDNAFTVKALYRLGFKWSLTDVEYIRMLFESVKTLGFFDV